MRRILFLISTLRGGGAERALCNITLAMPEDVEVDIVVNSISEADYPHKGNVISLNMPLKDKLSLPYQLKAFIKRNIILRKLKKEKNYDACISFMDSANVANILTGKKYCKVILSVRVTLSQSKSWKYKYIVSPLVKVFYPYADCVVALSKGTESDLNENFGLKKSKTTTIYNGYDLETIRKKASEHQDRVISNNIFRFVAVGRLCEPKGQWHLIRAFSEVLKNYPHCELVICGKGPYDSMLKRIVNDLNINDRVKFTGFLKNPFAIISRCDVFVFPSLYEGFGNVIIENMVCGLPVIATDFRYGAREVLAPDTDYKFQCFDGIEYAEYGIITPVCSGKKHEGSQPLEKEELLLAEAMTKLLEDRELRERYAEKSRKRANDFAIENTVHQWLELV